MRFIKKHLLGIALFISVTMLCVWYFFGRNTEAPLTSTIVETGTVRAFVSVSGTATVDDTIPLSFPKGGTISNVFVERGDTVATGTILATVGDSALQAEYAAALGEVTRTKAVRDELLNGQTVEESAVTETTIKNAETALSATILTERARVEAARTTLFSTGLTAVANDPDAEAPAPLVSGSYTCTAPGTYTITLYRSGTQSGYSYRYSGIETGTGNASTNQSAPLGECGLRLQFTEGAPYQNETYTITIPNTASALYATNKALYDQALAQQDANIAAAQRTLDLALNQATVATAGTRVEKLIAAGAVVATAEARLAQTSAALSDSAIRAPKSGVVTDLSAVVGQTVTTAPVITLFAPTKTSITARIPEKDIAKLALAQIATLEFDAQPAEVLKGTVSFLSPIPTVINGIPYYEADITLTETPTWLRSGMQADIQITTTELTDVTRIPRLFLQDNAVTIRRNGVLATSTPEILLIGTDGYVAVTGLEVGDELVLPQ